jgi:hypothetical protein
MDSILFLNGVLYGGPAREELNRLWSFAPSKRSLFPKTCRWMAGEGDQKMGRDETRPFTAGKAKEFFTR